MTIASFPYWNVTLINIPYQIWLGYMQLVNQQPVQCQPDSSVMAKGGVVCFQNSKYDSKQWCQWHVYQPNLPFLASASETIVCISLQLDRKTLSDKTHRRIFFSKKTICGRYLLYLTNSDSWNLILSSDKLFFSVFAQNESLHCMHIWRVSSNGQYAQVEWL